MRYSAYQDYRPSGAEWLGHIPKHWKLAKLRFLLCEKFSNGLFKKSEFWGDGTRIINVADLYLSNDLVNETSLERLECSDDEVKLYAAKHGDFFVVRSSLKLEGIGKSAALLNPTEETVFECHIVRGRPNLDEVHPRFLNLFMNSADARYYFMTRSNVVTMATIDQERIKNLVVAFPDYPEQQQIAAFLDWKTGQIDALIARKQELLEKLKEKRIAVITQAVTKGLNPAAPMRDSGIPWLGQVPQHWIVKRLRYCAGLVTSGSRGWAQYFSDFGALFLRITNLDRESIELLLEDIQRVEPPEGAEGARTLTGPGDLLISITADLGSVAVIPPDLEPAYVSQHLSLVRLDTPNIDPSWIAYSIFSHSGKYQLRMAGYGGTKVQLSLSDIKEVVFCHPPSLMEQQNILDFIRKETERTEGLIKLVSQAIGQLT